MLSGDIPASNPYILPPFLLSIYFSSVCSFFLFPIFFVVAQIKIIFCWKYPLFTPIIISPLFLLSLAATAQFWPESPSFLVARHLITIMIIIIVIIIICITDRWDIQCKNWIQFNVKLIHWTLLWKIDIIIEHWSLWVEIKWYFHWTLFKPQIAEN